jgi:hypothetical protein
LKETTNYKFKKRELTDVADITTAEDNWDTADTKLKEIETAHAAHLAETVQDEGGVHGLEYEEGTWTPVVEGGTEPGEGTYGKQEGEYKRIGKIVYIRVLVNITAHTGSGTLYISGLPFTPNDNYGMSIGTANNLTLGDNNVITGETYNGLPKIYLQTYPVGGGEEQLVQMDTSFQLKLSGFYFIN